MTLTWLYYIKKLPQQFRQVLLLHLRCRGNVTSKPIKAKFIIIKASKVAEPLLINAFREYKLLRSAHTGITSSLHIPLKSSGFNSLFSLWPTATIKESKLNKVIETN